jgi:hypothetical protein
MEQIEIKINELASKVLKNEHLESFLELPLNSKLIGMAVFAHLSGDDRVKKACLQAAINFK